MVKAYQRYSLLDNSTLGVIASAGCADALWVDDSGNLVLTANLDSLVIWNLRTSTPISTFKEEGSETSSEITCLTKDDQARLVCSGHQDGKVKVWARVSSSLQMSLDGHRSAVVCLSFNGEGTLLASGSQDTDIIVWDMVAESGLYKLRGHKDAVTSVHFLPGEGAGKLVSSSKDSLIKVWELDQQCCVQTLTGHRSEIWSLAVDLQGRRLVSGGADGELRVWEFEAPSAMMRSGVEVKQEEDVVFVGSLIRTSRSRVGKLSFCGDGRFLLCQTVDKNIQIFRVRTHEDAVRKMKRRLKRLKQKAADGGEEQEQEQEKVHLDGGGAEQPSAVDLFQPISFFSTTNKIRSAMGMMSTKKGDANEKIKILTSLTNNAVEVWEVNASKELPDSKRLSSLSSPGHRSDVRAVAISGDELSVASCSGGEAKVWNLGSGKCFRTVGEVGYGICCSFAPGDKYLLVGTKEGELHILDIAAAEIVETIAAHAGALWALHLHPDGKTFVTAGADKELKFWTFGSVKEEDRPARLGAAVSKAVTMEDDILAVSYSPDSKFLTASLLDTTIKVFYAESMKFFLSLYGHRLPVLSLDISSDSTLLVSGSADKNVKIWGLDFGDCHKSMLAHRDNVMAVKFVPRTHYFFSAGKDKLIKFWDADKFQLITTIKAHFAEIWCLAMSRGGDVLASGSHDRSVRIWRRTEEHIYLEEERQKELEDLLDANEQETAPAVGESVLAGEDSTAVAKQTKQVLDAADRITEALDLCAQFPEKPTAIQAAMLLGLTPNAYFRQAVKQIRSSELEPALMQLSFDNVLMLLERIDKIMAESLTAEAELLSRIVLFVVKIHHGRLTTTGSALPLLRSLRTR